MAEPAFDVVVVGGSNAALCAALAAREGGARAGPFDPAVLDGRRTQGITPPKSNWAQPLDTPPYAGFAVTCGITFTFGGLRISPQAEVLDTEDAVIPGLFYHNYPGGTGLTAGSVFGKLAGEHAAQRAATRAPHAAGR
jgi:tricarballylate dehydrogenase